MTTPTGSSSVSIDPVLSLPSMTMVGAYTFAIGTVLPPSRSAIFPDGQSSIVSVFENTVSPGLCFGLVHPLMKTEHMPGMFTGPAVH